MRTSASVFSPTRKTPRFSLMDRLEAVLRIVAALLEAGRRQVGPESHQAREQRARARGGYVRQSAVRGDTFNILFLDEFAFVPDNIALDFITSVFPADFIRYRLRSCSWCPRPERLQPVPQVSGNDAVLKSINDVQVRLRYNVARTSPGVTDEMGRGTAVRTSGLGAEVPAGAFECDFHGVGEHARGSVAS
jgi:hypothetical protein